MRAMIFAAGLGTRLKPFTLEHPKALVPVMDVPMLQRVISRLRSFGITEMVVNVHHFADQIIDFLRDHDNFGCTIHISDERDELLDTGGGILAARRWLDVDDEPFVVHNVDILSDAPIDKMVHSMTDDCLASLLVSQRSTSRYLLMDTDMRMRGWCNLNTGEVRPANLCTQSLNQYAFGGIHVLRPSIFPYLERYAGDRRVFSIIDFYVSVCTDVVINGYEMDIHQNLWFDIGKPDKLLHAEEALKKYAEKA